MPTPHSVAILSNQNGEAKGSTHIDDGWGSDVTPVVSEPLGVHLGPWMRHPCTLHDDERRTSVRQETRVMLSNIFNLLPHLRLPTPYLLTSPPFLDTPSADQFFTRIPCPSWRPTSRPFTHDASSLSTCEHLRPYLSATLHPRGKSLEIISLLRDISPRTKRSTLDPKPYQRLRVLFWIWTHTSVDRTVSFL
jgi:hypothetical protein